MADSIVLNMSIWRTGSKYLSNTMYNWCRECEHSYMFQL